MLLIMESGYMPEPMSQGLIYVIPKIGGISEDIAKWRPITLLNTIYKMLAKVLCQRLQPIMPHIIHGSQTGFIKGRSIFDNIFMFWESSSIALRSRANTTVLLLDFEKAYDRVDWDFLEAVMLKMGFALSWIKGVSALYRNASSQVLMAGGFGPLFCISRSVRQGCPLAPFLFLFFSEAMSTYFQFHRQQGLRGLMCPFNDEEIIDAELADDTTLYLHGSLDNLVYCWDKCPTLTPSCMCPV